MKTKVGLWIDHKQAIVVALMGQGQEVGLVVSQSERQPRRSGADLAPGRGKPRREIADDIRQRVLTSQLNQYYDAVIAAIGAAEAILIFGPGEAKGELKRRLERKKMGKLIAAVEPADKLTRPQVAARVRAYFTS
jgi:hypothetical protein